jgi:hypothetical protein
MLLEFLKRLDNIFRLKNFKISTTITTLAYSSFIILQLLLIIAFINILIFVLLVPLVVRPVEGALTPVDNSNSFKLNDDVYEFDDSLTRQTNQNDYYGNMASHNYNNNQVEEALHNEFPRSVFSSYMPALSPSKVECDGEVCKQGIFKWHSNKTKNLYVGGIFPMIGSWPGGQACLPSAIIALNKVNLNASILPEYRLNLNWFNSEVCF